VWCGRREEVIIDVIDLEEEEEEEGIVEGRGVAEEESEELEVLEVVKKEYFRGMSSGSSVQPTAVSVKLDVRAAPCVWSRRSIPPLGAALHSSAISA